MSGCAGLEGLRVVSQEDVPAQCAVPTPRFASGVTVRTLAGPWRRAGPPVHAAVSRARLEGSNVPTLCVGGPGNSDPHLSLVLQLCSAACPLCPETFVCREACAQSIILNLLLPFVNVGERT